MSIRLASDARWEKKREREQQLNHWAKLASRETCKMKLRIIALIPALDRLICTLSLSRSLSVWCRWSLCLHFAGGLPIQHERPSLSYWKTSQEYWWCNDDDSFRWMNAISLSWTCNRLKAFFPSSIFTHRCFCNWFLFFSLSLPWCMAPLLFFFFFFSLFFLSRALALTVSSSVPFTPFIIIIIVITFIFQLLQLSFFLSILMHASSGKILLRGE